MEIAVGLYIVGITLIMGYLINKYPRETIAILDGKMIYLRMIYVARYR